MGGFGNHWLNRIIRLGADYERTLVGLYRNPTPDILAMEYLVLRLRFQLFERDFNDCRYDLKDGFSYAKAKARQFARKAHSNQDACAKGYCNACVGLLKKLERKATEALEGHC